MRTALLLCAALALASCKPGGGIACPTLKGYSPAFLAAAEREVAVIEQTAPHVVKMIGDYGVERSAIRACLKRKRAG